MQKIKGKIAKLDDVLSGFGTLKDTVLTEEAFANYLDNDIAWQEITTEQDGERVVIGYFKHFWIEEVDGTKYLFGEGFVYDDIDFNDLIMNGSLKFAPDKES